VSTAAPGQTLTYTLTFTNTGPGAAHNIAISDTLPSGVSYQSCSLGSLAGSCSESGGTVTFTLTNPLAAGASASVTVTVQVTTSGPTTLTNSATLTYTDSESNAKTSVSASDTTGIPGTTAVVLTEFHLVATSTGWDILWSTGTEVNTRGFLIYRSTAGRDKAQLLTPLPIPARGSSTSGASYRFSDHTALVGIDYSYWLVEIELDGTFTEYGPLHSRGTISQQYRYFIPLIGR